MSNESSGMTCMYDFVIYQYYVHHAGSEVVSTGPIPFPVKGVPNMDVGFVS